MLKHAITVTVFLAAAAAYAADDEPESEPATVSTSPSEPATSTAATAGGGDEALASGLAAFRKRRFAKAADEFEKAVDANPQSAAAHFYLGYSIYKTAEPKRGFHPDKQKAAVEFAKAYELDPAFRPDWGKASAVARSK
jgi:Flp pilus assembly protein TadD